MTDPEGACTNTLPVESPSEGNWV